MVGKITSDVKTDVKPNDLPVAGAAKNTSQQHKYDKVVKPTTAKTNGEKKYVKTATIELYDTPKDIWKPNSDVKVLNRYSSRDRDQPESQLRKM